jgi:hypothetical protein
MRRTYVALSGLLLLALVAQMYFAAVGAFDRPNEDGSFALHSVNGMMVIPLLTVLATIAAALARAPGRLIGLTILPLGLVVVQVLLILVGNAIAGGAEDRTPAASLAIFGLHAINGLAMLGVSAAVLRRARALAVASRPAGTEPAQPASTIAA